MWSFLRLLVLATTAVTVAAGTNQAGLDFLAANADKAGVVVLPSGLQYKILTKGAGTEHPTVDSPCSCHYAGTLIDGTTFDSSYERGSPTTFAPNQVIRGWTEAMQLMRQGDKFELYIPSELGYGDGGSPPKIGGGDALIFQMEIIEIQGDKVPALTCRVGASSSEDCTEKEIKYIEKTQEWEAAKVTSEMERLTGLMANAMKPTLLEWIKRRVHILQQLASKEADEL